MSDEKPKIIGIPMGSRIAKNDQGALAREVAARVVEEKRQAVLKAIGVAQEANSDQREQLEAPKPVSRKQRKQEARKLRKLADESDLEREELKRIITEKAVEAKIPFQIFVQRMMDSNAPNLVEMAKIIRGIK